MTMETKKNIFREHLAVWLGARNNKQKRGEIVKHICFTAKVHPKSVPRSFRRVQLRGINDKDRRGRTRVYGADAIAALKEVWETASRPCGENLYSQIVDYVAIFRRDGMWHHSDEATTKLLAMSEGLVKLRVGKFSHIRKMVRGKSTTKPGSIKSIIPIRSGPWNDAPTGTVQIDTVAHCNDSIAGDFVYTVNATDVATLWGERHAQWNKGQEQTLASMTHIDAGFPYPILEWHPDTGSEFINWLCKRWTDQRKQKLTRSRPNRKNDNCFVEERNGHVIRKWIGYARLEAEEVVAALNDCYDILTPYLNQLPRLKADYFQKANRSEMESDPRKAGTHALPAGHGTRRCLQRGEGEIVC